ncbi:MAG: hypothetical protein CMP23_12375 [Rickettsiales bacterium]|nr:hypothetical protein [Rickettsiales bacterium]|tara:strand:- start:668 stop:1531 length:864 start_codon:yes stop_codon:yes gene_type:complete
MVRTLLEKIVLLSSRFIAGVLAVGLALLLPPWLGASQALGGAPEMGVLIERMSRALGGSSGGARALEQAELIDVVFQRKVKESSSGRKMTALHRFVQVGAGQRSRLDIRIAEGKGRDSATIVRDGAAFLLVDGAVHEISLAAVEARLGEFSPFRLFSVPLALATDGPQMLGDAALVLAGKVGSGRDSRFILVGKGADGSETARLELDANSYRPVEVAFRSAGGDIVYRYGDYRELRKGLIVPFRREFIRNGILLSTTEVLSFVTEGPVDDSLFDTAGAELEPLPGDR